MRGCFGCASKESTVVVVEQPIQGSRRFVPSISRSIGSFGDPVNYDELQQKVAAVYDEMVFSGRYSNADYELALYILDPQVYAKTPARRLFSAIVWKCREEAAAKRGSGFSIIHDFRPVFYDILEKTLENQVIIPSKLAEEMEEWPRVADIAEEGIAWLKREQRRVSPESLYQTLEKIALALGGMHG